MPIENTWSYGPKHEVAISKRRAELLIQPYPLPKMGWEKVIAGNWQKGELCIRNICGDFYAASATVEIKDWPEVFLVNSFKPEQERCAALNG